MVWKTLSWITSSHRNNNSRLHRNPSMARNRWLLNFKTCTCEKYGAHCSFCYVKGLRNSINKEVVHLLGIVHSPCISSFMVAQINSNAIRRLHGQMVAMSCATNGHYHQMSLWDGSILKTVHDTKMTTLERTAAMQEMNRTYCHVFSIWCVIICSLANYLGLFMEHFRQNNLTTKQLQIIKKWQYC